jgi:hypothetical protein
MFILVAPYCWYAGLAVTTAIAMPSFHDDEKQKRRREWFYKDIQVV